MSIASALRRELGTDYLADSTFRRPQKESNFQHFYGTRPNSVHQVDTLYLTSNLSKELISSFK